MRRRFEKPITPHARTEDDLFADQVRGKCAKAMVAHLKGSVNIHRKIGSLNLQEVMALAEACTAMWIGEYGDRLLHHKPDTEKAKQLKRIIWGG